MNIGSWWSGTARNNNNASYTDIGSSWAQPQGNVTKVDGFPLRCVSSFSISTISRRYPLSYIFTGFFQWSNGALEWQNAGGRFWSSTIVVDNPNNIYFLNVYTSFLQPADKYDGSFGHSLRRINTSSISITARRYPLSYIESGEFSIAGGNTSYQGTNGGWWTTTAYNNASAYALNTASYALNPINSPGKIYGYSLRCVYQLKLIEI